LSSVRSSKSDEIDTWFQEEFQSAAGSPGGAANDDDGRDEAREFDPKQDSSPFDTSLDTLNKWSTKYRTQKEAVDDLAAWAPAVLEYEPKKPAYDPLSWNSDWLGKAYLVVEDPHTLARLKTLCALFPDELDNLQVVLEYAMRFGMAFELYTKLEDEGTSETTSSPRLP
jgi:hypothetical protein